MGKIALFIAGIVFVSIGYIFHLDKHITQLVFPFSTHAKASYGELLTSISHTYNQYFAQSVALEKFYAKEKSNTDYKILYHTTKSELQALKKELALIDLNTTHETLLVGSTSYLELNDFSKIVLDYRFTVNKIYPLLTLDGYAAGIVRIENGFGIAYLNPNEKANYAVSIGTIEAPGITTGYDEKGRLLVRYIPKWFNLHLGDEVVTSGFDGVFPYGIRIGKVVAQKDNLHTKMAIIEPYSDGIGKKYFYLLKENIDPAQK